MIANGYVPGGFFVARTAKVPLDDYAALNRLSSEDRASRLIECFSDHLSDALWLASPQLAEAVRRSPDAEVVSSLYRYFVRAATRCNPFGEFAAVTFGKVGDLTHMDLDVTEHRVVRLDNSVVRRLGDGPPDRVYLTTPWYRVGSAFRYYDGQSENYSLAEVDASEILDLVSELARDGCEVSLLTRRLAAAADATLSEAAAYVEELWRSGILRSAVQPRATGDSDLTLFERDLHRMNADAGRRLEQARHSLEKVAARKMTVAEGATCVAATLQCEDHPPHEILQVDLVRSAEDATVGADVVDEIGRGAVALMLLRPRASEDALLAFRDRFEARWGDSAVPLLNAVDPDCGVTFGTEDDTPPLLEGFSSAPADSAYRWTPYERAFLERTLESVHSGGEELDLTNEDLSKRSAFRRLPQAFSVSCSLSASSSEALRERKYVAVLNAVSGAHGLRLMGRFCGVLPGLEDEARRFAAATEGDSRPIHAEISFAPDSREANVIRRSDIRDYEIPILSPPRPEKAIHLEDLDVWLHNGKFVLWDRARRRRIHPRLSVAHNFTRPSELPLYRFLGLLEEEESPAGATWDWGLLAASPFLPRVRFGRCILSRARWRIPRETFDRVRTSDGRRSLDALRRWMEQVNCPREVAAGDLDGRVTLDLTVPEGLGVLARMVRREGIRDVFEARPSTDNQALRLNGRHFAHELIVPFRRTQPQRTHPLAPAPPFLQAQAHGERWSYIKIYVNQRRMPEVLRSVGEKLMHAVQCGDIRKWFYVRYADPEWHLRIRLLGADTRRATAALRRLKRSMQSGLKSGIIRSIVSDVYLPEAGRYGGIDVMDEVETLFWRDSEAAVRLLESEALGPDWLLCVDSIHRLLTDTGWPLEDRLAFVRSRRDAYVQEIGTTSDFRRHASVLARRHLPDIKARIEKRQDVDPHLAPRAAVSSSLFTRLRELDAANLLSRSFHEILGSLTHMTANRLLNAATRTQEAFIFDFLARIYEAERAQTVVTER